MNKWIVKEKYRIVQEISTTSFSHLVELEDLKTKKRIAAKYLEFGNVSHNRRMKQESLILNIVSGQVGFPLFYGFQEESDISIILMELYGKSLASLFRENHHSFSPKTVLIIVIQLLNCLEYLHIHGIVHRDIKPENIVVGLGSNYNQFILVDYGLSSFYRDMETNEINPLFQESQFAGTSRYASINAHLGLSPSPRDDLESLAYMLVYFLKGSLPWQNLSSNYLIGIEALKKRITPEQLCEGLIPEFSIFLNEIRQMSYESIPDYSQFRALFINAFMNINFDWKTNISFSFSFSSKGSESKIREKPKPLVATKSLSQLPLFTNHCKAGGRPLVRGKTRPSFK